jgi:hypothetical protein
MSLSLQELQLMMKKKRKNKLQLKKLDKPPGV